MELKRPLVQWITILCVGMSLCVGIMHSRAEPIAPDIFDAAEYVRAAYNIFHHGIFSESVDGEAMPTSQVGREPLYGYVLSSIFYFEPAASQISTKCLLNWGSCPEPGYIHGKWLNIFFFALSGLFVATLARLVTGNVFAGAIAGFSIWINLSAQKNMLYMVSDPLALALSSALALALFLAMKRGNPLDWATVGLLLAGLILTKSIFLYFIPIALLCLIIWLFQNYKKSNFRFRIFICVVFISCLFLPLHIWMQRNHDISDQYTITVERSGLALNQRSHLNNMSWPEFGVSFVFWIRDCGDSLAAALFPEAYWDKLRLEHPDGYYRKAQFGYTPEVEQVIANEGVGLQEARKIVDSRIISSILERPFKHLVINMAVFWRGIWVDQFILISLPGLFFLMLWAAKNRNWALLAALVPSIFNLLIYPTISFNIPRYQLTALPALSLGTMFAVMWGSQLVKRKKKVNI